MEATRPGKSIGAKLARSLLESVGGARDAELEGRYPPGSRHQVYRLADERIVDLFLKSARLYPSREEFLADLASR
ncbi:MAG: hypothetical protein ACYC8T_14025 [Myxococcaceae bacterium]